jgi:hypothetical protein
MVRGTQDAKGISGPYAARHVGDSMRECTVGAIEKTSLRTFHAAKDSAQARLTVAVPTPNFSAVSRMLAPFSDRHARIDA